MRKTLAFLMVFVLLGPWLGLLCHCCPLAEAADVESTTVLTSACDSCCPEAINAPEKQNGIREHAILVQNNVRHCEEPAKVLWRATKQSTDADCFGPSGLAMTGRLGPPLLSNTPLYLSIQVLRI